MKAYILTYTIRGHQEVLIYADSVQEAREKWQRGEHEQEWGIDDFERISKGRIVRSPKDDR